MIERATVKKVKPRADSITSEGSSGSAKKGKGKKKRAGTVVKKKPSKASVTSVDT